MTWWCKQPGHQQLKHWPCWDGISQPSPDSKDPRIDIDYTSIRRISVGSMSNQCRSNCLCYLRGNRRVDYSCSIQCSMGKTFCTNNDDIYTNIFSMCYYTYMWYGYMSWMQCRSAHEIFVYLSLVQGIRDLFWLPVEQYRKDGRIVRGIQRGAHSFTTSTAIAALELTNRLVQTVQVRFGNILFSGQSDWSALVQVMACHLFGAKPLPKPKLPCCQLDHLEL